MEPDERDAAYLWDMLDAAEAVRQFVQKRTFHEYMTNRMLRGAVERHVEIIGEAAGKVSEPFRQAHPEIPWRRIIAQRNVLAHEYGEIKHELMWKVATLHITDVIQKLKPLIPVPPPEVKD